ncbi:hypothetical protein N7530_011522 [Penicillium desertorum]|uniref:Major facilitator superfamily (MFS) profile domain-containing protein n=1 Tax=Penicillium desertorum TaxID=1303715 RepID=A0A9W9WE12_9EURO|nr:hypothetical protein N7530_011522 [Penicillium desertorum]
MDLLDGISPRHIKRPILYCLNQKRNIAVVSSTHEALWTSTGMGTLKIHSTGLDPTNGGVVALLSFMGFTVTFTCISLAPIAGHVVDDLNGSEGAKSATVMLVTIWELGEAVGPHFIAPLSEIFGRYRLYLTMNTMFIVAILFAALSPSTELLIVSRALTGISVASNVLSPAIIGDMFVPEQRGTGLTLIMFTPLIGGTLGPIISGAVLQTLGWRAIIWISVVMASICQILFLTFFQETYKVQILRRRAARLSLEIGGVREEQASYGGHGQLGTLDHAPSGSSTQLECSGGSLTILEDIYGLSPTETGLVFIANAIGTIISFIISKVLLDKIYVKLRARNNGDGLPEYRLPLSIIGALTLPPAVILYGWCAEYKLPLCVLVFAMIWLRASVMLASSPLTAYIVDACGIYSASAMAGLISLRCLAGAFLPLSVSHLTERIGYGGGFSMLGGLGLVFALIPTLVFHYGAQWRQHSRYTASNS